MTWTENIWIWLNASILLAMAHSMSMAQSPGVQVGTTWYEHQTNGSTGNRIAVCNDGSIYMCWQKLYSWPPEIAERHVHYAWFDQSGGQFQTGRVDGGEDAGYTTMDVIYGNRAAIAYHYSWGDYPALVTLAIDHNIIHDFEIFSVPDTIYPVAPEHPGACFYPYIAAGRYQDIHIVMNELTYFGSFRVAYTRSQNGGVTWTDPVLVDTATVVGSVIDTSPVSDRVVIGLCKALDESSQWRNDIVYYSSEDGINWDFNNAQLNITDYANDNDSLWAYTDMDIIIDYDDNVHAVWNAQWVTDEGIYYRTYLFHYTEATGQITEITHKPHGNEWYSMEGTWNRPVCKMNMGIYDIENAPDGIFVTWTQFDTSDVSAGGYGNGELFMSCSIDNGLTWTVPENLTNSPTPGCLPGDCDSDNWSSLADIVNDSLHIIYMDDKDPAASQRNEGLPFDIPVIYLTVPNPLLTGIKDDDNSLPMDFTVQQNYPNPFNAETVIAFELAKQASVKLEIFDITGALVESLIDGVLPAGRHQITWEADGLASGIYFYKLKTDNNFQTRKAVLIK